MLGDGVEQRHRLQPVPGRASTGIGAAAGSIDCCTDATTSRSPSSASDEIAEVEGLWKVVASVDVHHCERERPGPERLLDQAEDDDRVLAAPEQHDGARSSAATSRMMKIACDFERGGVRRARPRERSWSERPVRVIVFSHIRSWAYRSSDRHDVLAGLHRRVQGQHPIDG